MTHIPAWRGFRRMQDTAAVAGSLIYALAALDAWRVLRAPAEVKRELILWAPLAFLVVTALGPLLIPPLRRRVVSYVWSSFTAGVGQSAASIMTGAGILAVAAAFIGWRLLIAARGEGLPAGLFCGYAAGIGVLWAQTVVIRQIEREPGARALIEEH